MFHRKLVPITPFAGLFALSSRHWPHSLCKRGNYKHTLSQRPARPTPGNGYRLRSGDLSSPVLSTCCHINGFLWAPLGVQACRLLLFSFTTPSIYLSIHPSIYLSISLSLYLSISLCIDLSIYLSFFLSLPPSLSLSLSPSLYRTPQIGGSAAPGR